MFSVAEQKNCLYWLGAYSLFIKKVEYQRICVIIVFLLPIVKHVQYSEIEKLLVVIYLSSFKEVSSMIAKQLTFK